MDLINPTRSELFTAGLIVSALAAVKIIVLDLIQFHPLSSAAMVGLFIMYFAVIVSCAMLFYYLNKERGKKLNPIPALVIIGIQLIRIAMTTISLLSEPTQSGGIMGLLEAYDPSILDHIIYYSFFVASIAFSIQLVIQEDKDKNIEAVRRIGVFQLISIGVAFLLPYLFQFMGDYIIQYFQMIIWLENALFVLPWILCTIFFYELTQTKKPEPMPTIRKM